MRKQKKLWEIKSLMISRGVNLIVKFISKMRQICWWITIWSQCLRAVMGLLISVDPGSMNLFGSWLAWSSLEHWSWLWPSRSRLTVAPCMAACFMPLAWLARWLSRVALRCTLLHDQPVTLDAKHAIRFADLTHIDVHRRRPMKTQISFRSRQRRCLSQAVLQIRMIPMREIISSQRLRHFLHECEINFKFTCADVQFYFHSDIHLLIDGVIVSKWYL